MPITRFFFIEHQLHEMFPVSAREVLAEELADIGGTSQRTIVFDCALPHERDAIDRDSYGTPSGTALRLLFLGKQSKLFVHETFSSMF